MNILILGSSGMLGRTLYEYFEKTDNKTYGIDRSIINFSNILYNDLLNKISNYNPDVILNAVGLIKQRKDVSDHEMIEINSVLPHKLCNISSKLGAKLIHFTTDCAFDGKKGKYIESDYPNAVDMYGRSKSLGEPEKCTVIRTSIIGEEKINKLSLVEWVRSQQNKTINGFTNHLWNGVTCVQLSEIINQIIKENLFWDGVRHIYSNVVNKYDLINYINNEYNLNIIINQTEDVYSIDRSLSSNYSLDNFAIPNLDQQIKEMKNFYAKK